MTPLEQIRLAAALVHTVPGAELRLETDVDDFIVISRHPAADLDPCALRRIVADGMRGDRPDLFADHFRRVRDVTLDGALTDLGGGVLASQLDGGEQRWIPSLLSHDRVVHLLDDVEVDGVPSGALHTSVRPDDELGVSVLSIATPDRRHGLVLDEVVAAAAARCFVAELAESVLLTEPEPDPGRRRRRP